MAGPRRDRGGVGARVTAYYVVDDFAGMNSAEAGLRVERRDASVPTGRDPTPGRHDDEPRVWAQDGRLGRVLVAEVTAASLCSGHDTRSVAYANDNARHGLIRSID